VKGSLARWEREPIEYDLGGAKESVNSAKCGFSARSIGEGVQKASEGTCEPEPRNAPRVGVHEGKIMNGHHRGDLAFGKQRKQGASKNGPVLNVDEIGRKLLNCLLESFFQWGQTKMEVNSAPEWTGWRGIFVKSRKIRAEIRRNRRKGEKSVLMAKFRAARQ